MSKRIRFLLSWKRTRNYVREAGSLAPTSIPRRMDSYGRHCPRWRLPDFSSSERLPTRGWPIGQQETRSINSPEAVSESDDEEQGPDPILFEGVNSLFLERCTSERAASPFGL